MAPLRRADIFVAQDCLDHLVWHSEFVEIRGEAPAISVPAFPLQTPGGLIATANWTAEGFVGRSFRLTAEMLPPPAGVPAPVLWGNEDMVFGSGSLAELRS